MFVPEKEHSRTGIVQLVHLVEVRHFRHVNQVADGEVLHFLSYLEDCLKKDATT